MIRVDRTVMNAARSLLARGSVELLGARRPSLSDASEWAVTERPYRPRVGVALFGGAML
jgi:hypothetical protein